MENLVFNTNTIDSEFLGKQKNLFDNINFITERGNKKYYKGYNLKTDRTVCLKIIDKEELETEDFERIKKEEEIIELCKCDYKVNIYNKYEFSNYIVYELEFYEMTLKKYLLIHGPLSRKLKFFTNFISNIADALKIMNSKGIIHRNIKPRNIYFDNNFNAKLGGFGCSIFSKENNNEPVGNFIILLQK